MKRLLPFAAFIAGLSTIVVLMPRFNAAQPSGIRLTRGDAVPLADAQARSLGIEVDQAWASLFWSDSALIDKSTTT